jgi:hypothetical protein
MLRGTDPQTRKHQPDRHKSAHNHLDMVIANRLVGFLARHSFGNGRLNSFAAQRAFGVVELDHSGRTVDADAVGAHKPNKFIFMFKTNWALHSQKINLFLNKTPFLKFFSKKKAVAQKSKVKGMKYDDYEMAAISMEGSDHWPSQWAADCDESFQKYKAAVDKGEKVSAAPFLAAQKLIYAKMADPDDCETKAKRPRFSRSKRSFHRSKRRFKRRKIKSRRRFKT